MTSNTQKKNYALPIVMMIILFVMISFVTGLQNPMAIIVKNQFGVSNFMSQLGNGANFIAYAFMGIPAGLLLQKIGYKKTALLAIIIGFLGALIQFISGQAGSFSVYLIGAFVAGFSMCMLNAVVNPMLNTLGGCGNKGNQLIQTGGAFNSLSATIVPVLVGYLIGDASRASISNANPALFIAMGVFVVVFIVLALVNIPEPYMKHDKKPKEKRTHSALSFRHFVLGAIGIFVYVGVEVGIPNTANLFMTTSKSGGGLNIATTIAGSVVGFYWFLMIIGRLIGASIGAKISSRLMLSVAAGLGIIFLLIGILAPISTTLSMPVFKSDISFGLAQVPIGIMFLMLCGICTSVMWGGIFNLAVEGLGKYTSSASGIFMVLVCGGGIIPLIQGLVVDHCGFLPSYWVIFICLAFLLFYALIGSKNVNKHIPVE